MDLSISIESAGAALSFLGDKLGQMNRYFITSSSDLPSDSHLEVIYCLNGVDKQIGNAYLKALVLNKK